MDFLRFFKNNLRWLLGGMVLTLSSAMGQTYFISLFSPEIRELFSLSHGDFGLIYMVGTLASAITLVFLGKITDYWPVAIASSLTLLTLGLMAIFMANITSLWMLFVAIFGLRLFGQGMCTQVAMTAMGKWYAKERGRAVSLASLGHQIGEGVLAKIIAALILLVGWRTTWTYAGMALIFIALPLVFSLMRVERIPRGTVPEDENKAKRHWTTAEVVRDPYFYLIALTIIAPAFIGTSTFFHQVHLAQLNGWERAIFPNSQYMLAITAVLSMLIGGWAVDRFSAIRLLPLVLIGVGLGSFLIASFTQELIVPIYMLLLGLTFGLANCLFGSLWPEIYGTKHLGSIRAATTAVMVFASALGPGLTGKLIDLGVGFESQLYVMGIYCFIISVIMVPVCRKCLSRMRREDAGFEQLG